MMEGGFVKVSVQNKFIRQAETLGERRAQDCFIITIPEPHAEQNVWCLKHLGVTRNPMYPLTQNASYGFVTGIPDDTEGGVNSVSFPTRIPCSNAVGNPPNVPVIGETLHPLQGRAVKRIIIHRDNQAVHPVVSS